MFVKRENFTQLRVGFPNDCLNYCISNNMVPRYPPGNKQLLNQYCIFKGTRDENWTNILRNFPPVPSRLK